MELKRKKGGGGGGGAQRGRDRDSVGFNIK